MYRKFTITDEANKQIVFKVYPAQSNLVITDSYDIDITLVTKQTLQYFVEQANKFMTGNTICKVEVEEEE